MKKIRDVITWISAVGFLVATSTLDTPTKGAVAIVATSLMWLGVRVFATEYCRRQKTSGSVVD